MTRPFLAVFILACALSGALSADRITYMKSTGGGRVLEQFDNVLITAWNVSTVSFRKSEGGPDTLATSSVVTITRVGPGGTMGSDLRLALETIATDHTRAKALMTAAAGKGSELDREEAVFRRAELFDNEARSNGRSALEDAIREYSQYHARYKAGFFARDSWVAQAELQQIAKRPADARATLRAMIGAHRELERLGNQKLGELEAFTGDFKAALQAFKAAENGSGSDRNARYLAIAWQGACVQRQGDNNAAREMLEKITGDATFEDKDSEDDEIALSVAWPALGATYVAAGNFEKAYNAYVQGAYYIWWNRAENEGHCLAQACICAKKLQATDTKWKGRYDKLRTALAVGFPKEIQRVDEAK